jgi:hypothetical protein
MLQELHIFDLEGSPQSWCTLPQGKDSSVRHITSRRHATYLFRKVKTELREQSGLPSPWSHDESTERRLRIPTCGACEDHKLSIPKSLGDARHLWEGWGWRSRESLFRSVEDVTDDLSSEIGKFREVVM